jgi:hypothetical protein
VTVAVDKERGADPAEVLHSSPPAEPVLRSAPVTRAAVETRLARLAPRNRVRQDGLWPFLLIRDFVGDDGRARLTRELRQSPDIVVVPGDVASLAAGSPTTAPRRNVAHSVFVHVWNLGRLAAIGVQLTVHAGPAPGTLVGTRFLDLPDRSDPRCHAVFRVPGLWVPGEPVGSTIRLVARVSCLLDLHGPEVGSNPNRHQSEVRFTLQP